MVGGLPRPLLPGGWLAACGAPSSQQEPRVSGAPEPAGRPEATLPQCEGAWAHGAGVWQGRLPGQGPLPGPQWVGRRPPGSGCEGRPSVAATINMFVQGKPGWELCAPARGGRKGRLYLAHWADCSCSRNRCPAARKVRRPSGSSEAPGPGAPCSAPRCSARSCHVRVRRAPAVATAPLGLSTRLEAPGPVLEGGLARARRVARTGVCLPGLGRWLPGSPGWCREASGARGCTMTRGQLAYSAGCGDRTPGRPF